MVPLSQSCLAISGRETRFEEGSGGEQADRKSFEMPGTIGLLGKLAAYDVDTMEEVWSVEQRPAFLTAALTTGLGGGSPRFVPARVSPEIKYPSSGNGLFVFRLP